MSSTKGLTSRDLLLIITNSLCLLLIINFLFIYFSPSLIAFAPLKTIQSISPCYRTLFHLQGRGDKDLNFVFGDSYSEGYGDEFLNGDVNYGIFKKMHTDFDSTLIFGRGGYGNKGTVIEYKRCMPLLQKYTSLELDFSSDYIVTFVFYEGNDLDNNLEELMHESNSLIYYLRFFFPLFDFGYDALRKLASRLILELKTALAVEAAGNEQLKIKGDFDPNKIMQGPAVELSDDELSASLGVLKQSLTDIKTLLPAAKSYNLLYLPSVASSYPLGKNVRLQSYKGRAFLESSRLEVRDRSRRLRQRVSSIADDIQWKVCDVTESITIMTEKGTAVHGPKDWDHFNKIGYSIVAESFIACLSRDERQVKL